MQFDDEERWVHRVRQSLERETAEELGTAAKVFDVPRALRDTKPEAYTPHRFALGPYHQGRPELRDMERYKLAAAKRVEKLFKGGRKIADLVQLFLSSGGLDNDVRATYHRYLEVNDVTLAWMMAIDTCFLLNFLEKYRSSSSEEEETDMVSSSSAAAGNWIGVVVRDAVMLENQVPLFLLAPALELCVGGDRQTTFRVLRDVLDRFTKDVSPIKISADSGISDTAKSAHLLELLYRFLVPDVAAFNADESDPSSSGAGGGTGIRPEEASLDEVEKQQFQDYDKVKQACVHASSLRVVRETLVSRASDLAGRITSRVPVLAGMMPLVGKLAASAEVQERLKGMNLGSVRRLLAAGAGAEGPVGDAAGRVRRPVRAGTGRHRGDLLQPRDDDAEPPRRDAGQQHGGDPAEPGCLRGGVRARAAAGARAVRRADERRGGHGQGHQDPEAERRGGEPDEEQQGGGGDVERDVPGHARGSARCRAWTP